MTHQSHSVLSLGKTLYHLIVMVETGFRPNMTKIVDQEVNDQLKQTKQMGVKQSISLLAVAYTERQTPETTHICLH